MRVTIEIEEAFQPREIKSFFDRFKSPLTDDKWWLVKTTIDLSEEGRAILTQRKLWKVTLFELDNSRHSSETPVLSFSIQQVFDRRPFQLVFLTPVDAKNFQHQTQKRKSYLCSNRSFNQARGVIFKNLRALMAAQEENPFFALVRATASLVAVIFDLLWMVLETISDALFKAKRNRADRGAVRSLAAAYDTTEVYAANASLVAAAGFPDLDRL